MSKALVLSYWNVNEPNTGGLRRVGALLEALEPDLLLCQPGPPHPRFPSVTFQRDAGRRPGAINWGLFNFFHPATARLVRRTLAGTRPGLVVLTSIWTYWPVRGVRGIPMVLDAHDVLAGAMAERYGLHHPFTLCVRWWEGRVARRVQHLFACSDMDRDLFMRLYGVDASRITVVPNGVRVSQFAEARGPDLPDPWPARLGTARALFFMGKLSYQPNAQALAFLNEKVLPALERQQPGFFKLVVCGGERPPGAWHSAMLFAGKVPDDLLRALLGRADICLAPIFTGSGTRLKILEYLAAGKPVISTPKGMEGLGAEAGRDLVAAEPESFAAAILDLANAPERARALGASGRRLVLERYDWASRIQPLWRDRLDRLARID